MVIGYSTGCGIDKYNIVPARFVFAILFSCFCSMYCGCVTEVLTSLPNCLLGHQHF